MVIVEIELLYISLLRINYNTQNKIATSYRTILHVFDRVIQRLFMLLLREFNL